MLLVGPAMADRSKVITQTKRDTPVLQVGGLGVGLTTLPIKKIIVTKVEQQSKMLDRLNGDGRKEMVRFGGRQEKMEGHCSTGQGPQWAVVPMEEGGGEEGGGRGGGEKGGGEGGGKGKGEEGEEKGGEKEEGG